MIIRILAVWWGLFLISFLIGVAQMLIRLARTGEMMGPEQTYGGRIAAALLFGGCVAAGLLAIFWGIFGGDVAQLVR